MTKNRRPYAVMLTAAVIGAGSMAFAQGLVQAAPVAPDLSGYVKATDMQAAIASALPDLTPYQPIATARTLPGMYTVQPGGTNPLPPAGGYQGKLAFVSDWEGGPGFFLSDGTLWRAPASGKCRIVTASATTPTLNFDALRDTNCVVVNGLVNYSATLNIVNPPDGYRFSERRTQPLNTILGAVGSLGVGANSSTAGKVSVTDATAILQWDAASASFTQVQ